MADENNIQIDIVGEAAQFVSNLNKAFSSLSGFVTSAIGLSKQLENEEKNAYVRSAKEFEARQKEKMKIYLAMIQDQKARAKEAQSAEENFYKLAENLSKQYTSNKVKREEDTARKLLDVNRKRVAEFQRIESEITKNAEREAAKQHAARTAAISTLAHSLPFGLGKTSAFAALNLETMAPDMGAATNSATGLAAAIGRIPVPIILGAAVAFQAVEKAAGLAKTTVEVLISWIEKGLLYNDLIETTTIGMAGVISQMTDIYRNQTKITDETERWQGSLSIAGDITEGLQDAALKTRAVYSELARGMQEGFAPMLQMGVKQDQVTPFVTRFIQLMSTLKIPLREIGQEIRAFSNLETNPRVARASFALVGMYAKEMGLSLEDAKKKLKEFKDDDTLIQWFMDNTKQFEKSGQESMHTLSGQMSNVKELIDRLLGEGTKELYEQLKGNLDKLVSAFVTFDKKGKAVFNQDAVNLIKAFASAVGVLAEALTALIPILTLVLKGLAGFGNFVKGPINLIAGVGHLFKDPLGKQNGNIFDRFIKSPDPSTFFENTSSPYRFLNDSEGPPEMQGPGTWDQTDVFSAIRSKAQKDAEALAKKAEKARIDVIDRHLKFINDSEMHFEELWQTGVKASVKRLEEWLAHRNSITAVSPEMDTFLNSIKNEHPLTFGGSGEGSTLKTSFDTGFVDMVKKVMAEYNKTVSDEKIKRQAEIFNKQVEQFWTGPMSNIFAELGTTGGENFMRVMAGNFDKMVSDSAEGMVDIISGIFLGGKKNEQGQFVDSKGQPITDQATIDRLNRNQKLANAGLGMVQIGIGSYAAGRTGAAGTQTAGLIGGGMAGAGIGAQMGSTLGPYGAAIGAVVGAIVGWIGAALGKAAAREEYKFATPYINDRGEATFTQGYHKNITQPEADAMLEKVQDTVDKYWNGFVQLSVKLGIAILPKFNAILGNFQSEASKNFLAHFEQWLSNTLPEALAAPFKNALKTAFVQLGLTAGQFEKIWSRLKSIDPSKTLELLNLLADTLINFKTVKDANPYLDLGGGRAGQTGGFGFNMKVGNALIGQSSAAWLSEADQQMRNLAAAAKEMTGEQQIRAMHELSQLAITRLEREKQLAQEIANFLVDSGRTFDQWRRNLTLGSMGEIVTDKEGNKTFAPDYEKQQKYLQTYLQKVMEGIKNATNPETLKYWQGEFFSTITQMQNIAGQGGPENMAAFTQWLMGVNGQGGILDLFQQAIQEQIGKIGTDIQKTTDLLFAAIQPALDDFTGSLVDVKTPIKDVVAGLKDLKEILSEINDDWKNHHGGNLSTNFTPTASTTVASDPYYESSVLARRRNG